MSWAAQADTAGHNKEYIHVASNHGDNPYGSGRSVKRRLGMVRDNIMPDENQTTDKKSLRILNDIHKLANDCVAFANAHGGSLLIGIENDVDAPPASQRIPPGAIERLHKRIPQLTHNVRISATVASSANGGEYVILKVFYNRDSIAATSDDATSFVFQTNVIL